MSFLLYWICNPRAEPTITRDLILRFASQYNSGWKKIGLCFTEISKMKKPFCQLLVVFREETLQYSVFVFPFQSFVSDNRYSKVSRITIQFVCLIAQYFWCPKKIQAYNTFSSDDEGLYLQNLKMTYHTASIMQHPTPLLSSCSFSEIPEAKTFCLKMQV